MTVAAWVFLVVVWTAVTGITAWLFLRVVRSGRPKDHSDAGPNASA